MYIFFIYSILWRCKARFQLWISIKPFVFYFKNVRPVLSLILLSGRVLSPAEEDERERERETGLERSLIIDEVLINTSKYIEHKSGSS